MMETNGESNDSGLGSDLSLWIDETVRLPGAQMAMDEAMLEFSREVGSVLLRIYGWDSPAVTIGYFDPFPATESRPVIRRITGGGLVEHGNDVTFCLILPENSPAAQLATIRRYQLIHQALYEALIRSGLELEFAQIKTANDGCGPCFQAPVMWDLLCRKTGLKIAGGAQRRSRGSVIHQGSVLLPVPCHIGRVKSGWMEDFASHLGNHALMPPSWRILLEEKAAVLASSRYQQTSWNEKVSTPRIRN